MVEKNYLIHPYYIIIFLVLAGITALFLGFSAAYVYTRVQEGTAAVELPQLFYWNTLLLVACSFFLMHGKKAYQYDNTKRYQSMLALTIITTIGFLALQIVAWRQMQDMNIMIDGGNLGSYLYVISALHFAHVIAGIPFLLLFLRSAVKNMKEPVTVLVYFSDPDKKRKLDLLTVYWHFLDVLWIYLVIFFLVNYLIN